MAKYWRWIDGVETKEIFKKLPFDLFGIKFSIKSEEIADIFIGYIQLIDEKLGGYYYDHYMNDQINVSVMLDVEFIEKLYLYSDIMKSITVFSTSRL